MSRDLHPDRARDCPNCGGHGYVIMRRATGLDKDGRIVSVERFRAPCSRCDESGYRARAALTQENK